MKHITYLFGAGASREAIPIVKELPDRLVKIIEILTDGSLKLSDEVYPQLDHPKYRTKRNWQERMIEDLMWLKEHTIRHASIDTFAKKLYIRSDKENLRRFKTALSLYITIEQSIKDNEKKQIDTRYDGFFASLLDPGIMFPIGLKILSWNYDQQFEIAMADYCNTSYLPDTQRYLGLRTKGVEVDDADDHQILYKLNGTAAFYTSRSRANLVYFLDRSVNKLDLNFIDNISYVYADSTFHNSGTHLLSFAWENRDDPILMDAINSVEKTEILVIIGYSFPFFNREIDGAIIQNMKNLNKVYIQAPDADVLLERFGNLAPNFPITQVIPKFGTDYFFIPNEL